MGENLHKQRKNKLEQVRVEIQKLGKNYLYIHNSKIIVFLNNN